MNDVADLELLLSTQEEFDPYQLYQAYPVDTLVDMIGLLIKDNDRFEAIVSNELYKENLLKLVKFLYLRALAEKTNASVSRHKEGSRKTLFPEPLFAKIYSLTV